MDLDDIAFGVIEEDLMPAIHCPRAVIRIRHAFFLKPLLECFDVIGPERDMTALERIVRDLFMRKATPRYLMRPRSGLHLDGRGRYSCLSAPMRDSLYSCTWPCTHPGNDRHEVAAEPPVALLRRSLLAPSGRLKVIG